MKHLGDITKIHGCTVPVTDVVIGGSPCQDLSVAGKRAGLAGERSGLFMEQIRVIKEMRQNDRDGGRSDINIRPRYMVWENVPGTFSSNSGEDFRAVLEETAHIADENAVIPQPPKGKWTTSGAIMGDGWSIAWRVLDAQFWGVPQRRRRISLVADFGGQSAPEILFERKGVPGDFAESGTARERAAADVAGGAGKAIGFDGYNQCLTGPVSQSIRANKSDGDHVGMICYGICSDASNSMKSANPHSGIYEATTARTLDLNGGNPACNQGGICVAQSMPLTFSMQGFGDYKESNQTSPCKMRDYKDGTDLVAAVDVHNSRETGEVFGTLQAKENGGQSLNYMGAVRYGYAVRRLTPLECERLQGFPDGWTDIGAWTDSNGKLHKESSDSARYKALGNSIALPPWKWVLKRLSAFYERDATMASLFDGIGGFPLIWEQLNGRGSCLWASEIEEFPIAVTKFHFGEASR